MTTAAASRRQAQEGQPPARRRRLEPEDRRRQILSCAVRLFGEYGYDQVTNADVAREAGVTRALVNHYFGTKQELYLEVVRVMATIPENALFVAPDGDLTARVDAAVTWFLDAVERHVKTWLVAVASSGPARSSQVAEVVAQADEVTVDQILRVAGIEPHRDASAQELRAVVRSYVHFARAGAVEWLVRDSLTREQTHRLLSRTLVSLLDDRLGLATAAQ